jgi:hypothetical protein
VLDIKDLLSETELEIFWWGVIYGRRYK